MQGRKRWLLDSYVSSEAIYSQTKKAAGFVMIYTAHRHNKDKSMLCSEQGGAGGYKPKELLIMKLKTCMWPSPVEH